MMPEPDPVAVTADCRDEDPTPSPDGRQCLICGGRLPHPTLAGFFAGPPGEPNPDEAPVGL